MRKLLGNKVVNFSNARVTVYDNFESRLCRTIKKRQASV